MFCRKCGAKNDDNARFCEECGAPIEPNNHAAPYNAGGSEPIYYNNPCKNSMSLKTKIIVLVVAVLVVVFAGLYYVGGKLNDPKKTAENYFVSIMNGDYASAYDCLEIEKNQFTDKAHFVASMKKRMGENHAKVKNYTITEAMSNDVFKKEFNVKYVKEGSSSENTYRVILSKQSRKKWFFYDDYMVVEEGIVIHDYKLNVPVGASVKLDGKKVDKKFIADDDNNNAQFFDCYRFDSIFSGEHSFNVTSPYMLDAEFVIDMENNGSYTLGNITLNNDSISEINQVAEEAIQQVYNAAIEGKNFDSVKKYFVKNNEGVKDEYDDLCDDVNDDDYQLKNIGFIDYKFYGNKNLNISGGMIYRLDTNVKYNYTYVYDDWFDGQKEYSTDDPASDRLSMSFAYDDGKWLISDFDFDIYW